MQENPRLSCILDSTPWIPFFRYRVPDFLSVELGFRIPVFSWWDLRFLELYSGFVILLHEKFLQFDWLRAVVFQPNLKNLHVKKKKWTFYSSVNVFSTKVLVGDTIFTSPNGDGPPFLRGHPSHAMV